MKERVKQILKQGEGLTVEFKAARRALNRDLYETVCAFLNREGGDITLGLADELGSGVRNLYKYGKAYGGEDPEILENDIFRVIVSVPDDDGGDHHHHVAVAGVTSEKSSGKTLGKTSGKIIDAVRKDPQITIPELAKLIGVTERSIDRNISNLQSESGGKRRLRRVGPAKGGYWEVLE